MQMINGFINVDTADTEGVWLSTKCGELKTKKENRRLEVYNNSTKTIFCTVIINGDIERHQIEQKKSIEIVFKSSPTEIRIYFGLPFEGSEYSYTSVWGDNYGGNPHVLGLFYMVNSTFV
jgi:hypothetical protein